MAELTKEVEGTVILLNRGKRHYDIGFDESGKARRHSPGATMVYTAEEAKRVEAYAELVDISKIPGQVNPKAIKAENAKLVDENASLKAQLEALQNKKSEPKTAKKTEIKEEVKA